MPEEEKNRHNIAMQLTGCSASNQQAFTGLMLYTKTHTSGGGQLPQTLNAATGN
jgi:hypothetical protein